MAGRGRAVGAPAGTLQRRRREAFGSAAIRNSAGVEELDYFALFANDGAAGLLPGMAGLALKAKALAMTLPPHDFSVVATTTTGSFVAPS